MASEALTFKGVTVSSPSGLPTPTPGEVVLQPGIGIVVFVHGEPRFVLRQEDGFDVFLGSATSTSSSSADLVTSPGAAGGSRDVSIVSNSGIVKIAFMTDGNAKSFKQAIDRSKGDATSSLLRSSIHAEAGMARAVTAMEAAARDEEYSRHGLAGELARRREQHRVLAQRFSSGSDVDALLLRERFSTAAERSRQRLDQVETRHIERLEAALLANKSLLSGSLASDGSNGRDNGNGGDRQRLWDAWGEAEAYRDQDLRRVGAANKRDNQSAAAWQEHQKKRQKIFDDIQSQLREIDNTSSQPGLYASHHNSPSIATGDHQQHHNPYAATNQLLSPQSIKLVSQVRSLLGEHQSAVEQARGAGAAAANAEIAELRAKEADFIRREQELKAQQQAAIAAEMERQLQEQQARLARLKAEAEEEDRRRRQLMEEAKNTVRMQGDWKEIRRSNGAEPNYFVNVLTGRTTSDINETPWKEVPRICTPDPVLATVKVASSASISQPQPQQQAAATAACVASQLPSHSAEAPKPRPSSAVASTPAASVPSSPTAGAPKVGDVLGDWKVHHHAASDKIYFVNKKENKTTWNVNDTPWAASSSSASASVAVASSPVAAVEKSVSSPTGAAAPPKAGDVLGDWKCHHHAASDKLYFVNKAANKTTWNVKDTPWGAAVSSTAVASPVTPASPLASPASPAAAPKAGDVLGDWKCHHHPASDKIYFVNKKENKTTWNVKDTPWGVGAAIAPAAVAAADKPAPPKAGDVLGDWKCHHHAASDKLYFVNKAANKTTWNVKDTPWAGSELTAAVAAPAAAAPKTLLAPPKAGDVRGDWKCHHHAASDKLYFVNKKENKTTWNAAETGVF